MKKLVFALCLFVWSFAALAQSVMVRNYRSSFSLEVRNRQPHSIRCSGPIQLHYDNGRMDVLNASFVVRPQAFFNRTYVPTNPYPINHIFHNIWCR